jgi:hypothetical protein
MRLLSGALAGLTCGLLWAAVITPISPDSVPAAYTLAFVPILVSAYALGRLSDSLGFAIGYGLISGWLLTLPVIFDLRFDVALNAEQTFQRTILVMEGSLACGGACALSLMVRRYVLRKNRRTRPSTEPGRTSAVDVPASKHHR